MTQADDDAQLTPPRETTISLRTTFRPAETGGIVPVQIGREAEMQQLVAAFYTLLETNQAQLVTVLGSQGVGKSRLAHEFRRTMAQLPETVQFFALQADSELAARPYGLIRALVAAFVRVRPNDTPERALQRLNTSVLGLLGADQHEAAEALAILLGFREADSSDSAKLREDALHAIWACTEAIAREVPIVLVIDDLHLADPGSLDILDMLVRRQNGIGINMLFVALARRRIFDARPNWSHGLEAQTIDLQPLPDRESRLLVGEILRKAGKLPTDLRSLIVSRAEGNPLYIEELIAMLISDGVIDASGDVWHIRTARLSRLRVPASLRDILQARIAAFTHAEQALLEGAAIVGRTFWDAAVRALLPSQPLEMSVFAQLERREMIVAMPSSRFPEMREYSFRHALMHEVVYERIPLAVRQSRHQQVAEWLIRTSGSESPAHAAAIAEQYANAGAAHAAAEWFVYAGQHAVAAHAVEQAYGYFKQAEQLVAASPPTPLHLTLHQQLADVTFQTARTVESREQWQRLRVVATTLDNQAAIVQALHGLARYYDSRSEYQNGLEVAQEALEVARNGAPASAIATTLNRLGWAKQRLERHPEALAHSLEALAIFEELGDHYGQARSLMLMSSAHEGLSQFSQAITESERSITLLRNLGARRELATALNNLAYLQINRGDFASALVALEEDLQIAREIDYRMNELYALSNLCVVYAMLGDSQAALDAVQRGTELCAQARLPLFSDFPRAEVIAYLQRRQTAEALDAAQRGLAIAQQQNNPREVGMAWRYMGMAFAVQEDNSAAASCFVESERLLSEIGSRAELARTLREAARYAAQLGDAEAAAAQLTRARDLFSELGLDLELARTEI